MKTERLTNLEAVKQWLDIESSASDKHLVRIIEAASRFIVNFLNWKSLKPSSYTHSFSGNGGSSMLLRHWPVVSVDSVYSGGTSIPASTFNGGLPSSGFFLGEDREGSRSLNLSGYRFGPGQVTYVAGFQFTETLKLSVPDEGPFIYTPNEAGEWTEGYVVTIDEVEALEVEENPSSGEYTVSEWGEYTFSVDDSGKVFAITYAYAPWDISQACVEIVGEWYKKKERIGVLSKTLGGQETVRFSDREISESARAMLQPYANVVPV